MKLDGFLKLFRNVSEKLNTLSREKLIELNIYKSSN